MIGRYLSVFCAICAFSAYSTEQANYLIFNIQDEVIYKLVVDDTLRQALETQTLSCTVNSTKGIMGANIFYSRETHHYEINLALVLQRDANREPESSVSQLFDDFSHVGLFFKDSVIKLFASVTAQHLSIVRGNIDDIPVLPLSSENHGATPSELASCELY